MNKCDPLLNWKLELSISGAIHRLLYRSEYKGRGVQMEIHTPVIDEVRMEFGEAKRYFFIDGDERQFRTQEEMMEALNAD